jgi:hypothetical protein
MNPKVKVAYERRWWVWHNVVLEIPVIKLWISESLDVPPPLPLTLLRSLVTRIPAHGRRLDMGIRRTEKRLLYMGRTVAASARTVSGVAWCGAAELGSGLGGTVRGFGSCIFYTLVSVLDARYMTIVSH